MPALSFISAVLSATRRLCCFMLESVDEETQGASGLSPLVGVEEGQNDV